MSNDVVVVAKGLVKTYRKGDVEIRAVNGIDLEVRAGELVALMGPSGSGKSTLLHLIGGLDAPDAGTCSVGDHLVTKMSESELCAFRAGHVGFIFQVFNLVPVLTARENVELPLRLLSLSRARRRAQVDAALDLVGLADRADHLPSQLSGGQEQRVAIARALVTDPDVIIADEPTGDLDEASGDKVVDILRELAKEHGKTVLMVTHDAAKAERADRVLLFRDGKLTERGDPEPRKSEEA